MVSSIIHALAYSFIGIQTLYLGVNYPIYWNTAYLIVNSGALDNENESDDDDKQEGTNYAKEGKIL